MYQTIRVDLEQALSVEPLGTKWKFWYTQEDRRTLFKAEERGTGEDWAEKIVSELCELLGLPHVAYDLAELYADSKLVYPGVVCGSCAPSPWSLVLGNQLLLAQDPAYPAKDHRKYKVRGQTIAAVADVIGPLEPPPASWRPRLPQGINTALDVYVGYVMLDAWVANQDRHHENWGALRDDRMYLAPTFDHGASLARNLSDRERTERLTTNDKQRAMPAFAARARSGFYRNSEDKRPLTTMEAFERFAGLARGASQDWLARLSSLDQSAMQSILGNVPENRLSPVARQFTLELLLENQLRLCSLKTQ